MVFFLFKTMIFGKKDSPMPIKFNPAGLNFKKDIEFLEFYIDFKFNDFKVNVLNVLEATGSSISRDESGNNIYDDHFEKLTIEVVESLSSNYIFIMSSYFTKQSLKDYIIRRLLSMYRLQQIEHTVNKIYKK